MVDSFIMHWASNQSCDVGGPNPSNIFWSADFHGNRVQWRMVRAGGVWTATALLASRKRTFNAKTQRCEDAKFEKPLLAGLGLTVW